MLVETCAAGTEDASQGPPKTAGAQLPAGFPPPLMGSVCFSGLVNNVAAIRSEKHSATAANGSASDRYYRLPQHYPSRSKFH